MVALLTEQIVPVVKPTFYSVDRSTSTIGNCIFEARCTSWSYGSCCVRDEVLDKVALPLLTDQVPVYPDAGAVADKTKVLNNQIGRPTAAVEPELISVMQNIVN